MTTLAAHRVRAVAALTADLAAITTPTSHVTNLRHLHPVHTPEPDMTYDLALSLLVQAGAASGVAALQEAARIIRAMYRHPSTGGPL